MRFKIVPHETGIVCWSAALYFLGLRVALITSRPYIIRFRASEPRWGECVLFLHLGRWSVTVGTEDTRHG